MFKEKDFSNTEIVINQTLLSFDRIELVFGNAESVIMDKSVIHSISMENFSERVIYAGHHQANPSEEKINLKKIVFCKDLSISFFKEKIFDSRFHDYRRFYFSKEDSEINQEEMCLNLKEHLFQYRDLVGINLIDTETTCSHFFCVSWNEKDEYFNHDIIFEEADSFYLLEVRDKEKL